MAKVTISDVSSRADKNNLLRTGNCQWV